MNPWPDYALLDSGGGRKLEQFGSVRLIRPESQAVWEPRNKDLWKTAQAEFSAGERSWTSRKPLPDSWIISYRTLKLICKLSPFRHTGIFPEQYSQWEWLQERLSHNKSRSGKTRILNLFGYTGVASMVASSCGAHVTHVDASKQAVAWARANCAESGFAPDAIRWIIDDATKFVAREVRRGQQYDGIILDPPSFGRGPKGEEWKFEEGVFELLNSCGQLLPEHRSFLLLTVYSPDRSVTWLRHLLTETVPTSTVEAGELTLCESGGGRCISHAVYGRCIR
jgi:23S rRNA (cytosine1962-C5)-methyltransferase